MAPIIHQSQGKGVKDFVLQFTQSWKLLQREEAVKINLTVQFSTAPFLLR
jgi:hypothetical protein